jgi:hypothetical protein
MKVCEIWGYIYTIRPEDYISTILPHVVAYECHKPTNWYYGQFSRTLYTWNVIYVCTEQLLLFTGIYNEWYTLPMKV